MRSNYEALLHCSLVHKLGFYYVADNLLCPGDEDDEDAEDEDEDETEGKKGKKKGKKMDESKRRDSNASDKSEEGDSKRTNQFSFVERATQTMNNALKVQLRS